MSDNIRVFVDSDTANGLIVGNTAFLADGQGRISGTVVSVTPSTTFPGDFIVELSDFTISEQYGEDKK